MELIQPETDVWDLFERDLFTEPPKQQEMPHFTPEQLEEPDTGYPYPLDDLPYEQHEPMPHFMQPQHSMPVHQP